MPNQINFTRQSIPEGQVKSSPIELKPQNRKAGKQGSKVVFDGRKAQVGNLSDAIADLNKLTLIVPPNSKITVTLTMSDLSQKKMVFENVGEAGDVTARIYFDRKSQTFAVAEGDVKSKKPVIDGPASQPFQTNRLIKTLKKDEDDVVYSGNAHEGVQKKSKDSIPASKTAEENTATNNASTKNKKPKGSNRRSHSPTHKPTLASIPEEILGDTASKT